MSAPRTPKGAIVAVACLLVILVGSARPTEARGPHVFFAVGVPLWVGPWWGPPYAYPSPPAVILQQPPAVQAAPPAPVPVYWYYCPNPQGYYPYVRQCAAGWMQVFPPSAPPGQ